MNGITDIHSHILFRVDDGSDSEETSLEILKREYEQGVSNVILTPHYDISGCMPSVRRIKSHFEQLVESTKKVLPEMKLYLGNEIMACNDMVEMLEEGRLFSLAGSRYVLIEFYPSSTYENIEKSLRDVLNGGYIPIVAHCERYNCLRKRFSVIDRERIRHLCEMGARMQVNVATVFRDDKKFVKKMIENDLLHFIASDAHSIGRRGVFWDECIKFLQRSYSDNYIKWLLVDNPTKILEGKYL